MRHAFDWKRSVAVLATFAVALVLETRTAAQIVDLDQGWSKKQSDKFWFHSQGSRIMLKSWFTGLEQEANASLLSDPEFLESLGFIVAPPNILPIGFAAEVNQSKTATYVGLTCAACHTSRLNIEGMPVIVEGGPAIADFSGLLNALVGSTQATLKDDAKFERFAARVNVPASGFKALRSRLSILNKELTERRDQNAPTDRYGFGRVDAFGHIFNRVFSTAIKVDDNRALPDAPVSYPFLWDTPNPIHERVQWNWSAPNAAGGDLFRNMGEVLGVFAYFDVTKKAPGGLPFYPKSSVRAPKLIALERLVKQLHSPKWPANIKNMAIDPVLADQGKAIYAKTCESCHRVIDRLSGDRRANECLIDIAEVGTDRRMTDNWNRRMLEQDLKTGLLKGRAIVPVPNSKTKIGEFGDVAKGREILTHVLAGVFFGQFLPQDEIAPQAVVPSPSPPSPPPPPPGPPSAIPPTSPGCPAHVPDKGYKARPLNGIWATAPYLHNGSVPTLAVLLNAERGAGFWISSNRFDHKKNEFYRGSNRFNPTDVGFSTEQTDGAFWFDTSKDGNKNTGHLYGTGLAPTEKKALIEFLKTR